MGSVLGAGFSEMNISVSTCRYLCIRSQYKLYLLLWIGVENFCRIPDRVPSIPQDQSIPNLLPSPRFSLATLSLIRFPNAVLFMAQCLPDRIQCVLFDLFNFQGLPYSLESGARARHLEAQGSERRGGQRHRWQRPR